LQWELQINQIRVHKLSDENKRKIKNEEGMTIQEELTKLGITEMISFYSLLLFKFPNYS